MRTYIYYASHRRYIAIESFLEISSHIEKYFYKRRKLQSKKVALLHCSTPFYLSLKKKFIHIGLSVEKNIIKNHTSMNDEAILVVSTL